MQFDKPFEWSLEKNELLKRTRGVCFEDVVQAIDENDIIAVGPHPNRVQFPHQQIFVVNIRSYIYKVPFVEDGEKYFLKTIIPDRILRKKYLGD